MQLLVREQFDEEHPNFRKAIDKQISRFASTTRFRTPPTATSIEESGALLLLLLRIYMSIVDASEFVRLLDCAKVARKFHRIAAAG